MTSADLFLEASRILIGLGLSVWIGGSVLLAVSSSEAGGEVLDRLKFIVAGCILVGLLLEVQVLGSSLPPRRVARAIVLFLLIASHVYVVMVVQPKTGYYREKVTSFEEEKTKEDPWRAKYGAERRKSEIVSLVGLLFAVVSFVLG
jgi:hypothetical protein